MNAVAGLWMFALLGSAGAACMPPQQQYYGGNYQQPPAAGPGNYAQQAPATRPSPAQPPPADSRKRQILINGQPARAQDLEVLAALEAQSGRPVPDGSYWYDRVSGAAGLWGGPAQWLLPPNLPLGGPLPRQASAGNTGIIINGREIHYQDAVRIQQLLGMPPQRGRWWVDAQGNFGPEGGPPLGNLNAAAQRGGQGRAWSRRWADGEMNMASDGQTTCVNTDSYTRCY